MKIILADNQVIFRAGMAKVLAVEDDLRIVAQAETASQMLRAMGRFRSAVLIADLDLVCADPETTGAASIFAHANNIRVVVLDERPSLDRTYPSVANGVIYRNIASDELVQCVRKIGAGEPWYQNTKLDRAVTENDLVATRVKDRLTSKELRIVGFIAQGYKNKEIGVQVGTTEQVVKNYLSSIYDKVGVSDRLELALFTIQHRILLNAAQPR